MALPFSGLTGPVLNFANAVSTAFDNLISVRIKVVANVAALPPATAWQGRPILVRDIGGGNKGIAYALDGVWINYAGTTL
jgi:hypothetical protein